MSQLSYDINPALGVKGQVSNLAHARIESMRANGTVRVGTYVVRGTNRDAAHPAADPDPEDRGGIAVRDPYRVKGTDDSGDYADNEMFGMLTEGECWVECETGSGGPAVENTPVFVRITAATGKPVGGIRADADTDKAVHIPGLYFRSAGAIALVEVRRSSYVL